VTEIDTLLLGGMVVDGSGDEPYVGTVGLCDGLIASVSRGRGCAMRAPTVIDCAGLIVCPGFIDIHTHSDVSFLIDPLADSKIVQGVTTEVTGNCGFSPFPVNRHRRRELEEFIGGLGMPRIDISWDDFDGYAQMVEARQPVMNVAALAGHGALRIAASGTAGKRMDAGTVAQMQALMRADMERGVFGLSTGLTYVPSKFATSDEIHALATVVREHDGLYATHSRATAGLHETFEEAIDVGRRTAARVQFSHVALNDPRFWGRAGDVIELFVAAREEGIDVCYDVYPYDASASSMTQYLPGWLQEQGESGVRRMCRDRDRYERAQRELAQGLFGTIPWDWSRVVLSLTGAGDEDLEGLTVAAAAARRNISPEEICLDLCAKHGNSVQAVLFYRDERDVAEFVRHPLGILGSDGLAMSVAAAGQPHPRSFGAHARLIQRYVRERSTVTLARAIHMCTLAPARRLGLRRRGSIIEGWAADVVALDLAQVQETGTWVRPKSLATGVKHVWVNGERVLSDGRLTGVGAGRVLRRGVD
jgi:N-acyl-D-aspartate/D-glutamate deacylase